MITNRDKRVASLIVLLSAALLAYLHAGMVLAAKTPRRAILASFGLFAVGNKLQPWQVVANWLITLAITSVALISVYKLISMKSIKGILLGIVVLVLYVGIVPSMLTVVFE